MGEYSASATEGFGDDFSDIAEALPSTEAPEQLTAESGVHFHDCQVCSTSIECKGDKRHRKLCSEHTGSRTTRGTGKKGKRTTDARLNDIQQNLYENSVLFGKLVGGVVPTTGYVIVEESDAFTASLVRMAKGNPKLLAALEKAGQVTPVVTIGKTVAKILLALMVDFGRLKPDFPAAMFLDVTKAYNETHPEGDSYAPRLAFLPTAPPPVVKVS